MAREDKLLSVGSLALPRRRGANAVTIPNTKYFYVSFGFVAESHIYHQRNRLPLQ